MHYSNPEKIIEDLYILGTITNPVYLMKGNNEWLLVEGGIETDAPLILSQLQSIIPDLSHLKHWFITHSHYDHCGAIEFLYPFIPGARLYASKEAIENFRNLKYVRKIRELNRLLMTAPGNEQETLIGQSLNELPFTQLNDLDRLVMCGQHWTVLQTPGHSRCSLSLYSAAGKKLFVSDALGEFISPGNWFPMAFESMRLFMSSANRLSKYPADIVALGHHGISTGKDAANAASTSLRSSQRLVQMVDELSENGDYTKAREKILETYPNKSGRFVPLDVYEKSIDHLLKIIHKEEFIT